jgi:hypothetical protein
MHVPPTHSGVPERGHPHIDAPGATPGIAASYLASPDWLIVDPPHLHPLLEQISPLEISMQSELVVHDWS